MKFHKLSYAALLTFGGLHVASAQWSPEYLFRYGNNVNLGTNASAIGSSIAIGHSSYSSVGSIAIGTGVGYDYGNDEPFWEWTRASANSIAIGEETSAWGVSSLALGNRTTAAGPSAVAIGTQATASGTDAVTIGRGSFANANQSTAVGAYVQSHARGSVALGTYNRGNQRRDGGTVSPSNPHSLDPLFTLGNGTGVDALRSNAFTVYRDGSARFEGAVEIKTGANAYLTLQPSAGTTNRTLTLPDMDGTMLTSNSPLDPAKLAGGTLDENLLPALAEMNGDLPWDRVSGKPATLAAAGYTDAIVVEREMIGGVEVISTPLRIKRQGDIRMIGEVD